MCVCVCNSGERESEREREREMGSNGQDFDTWLSSRLSEAWGSTSAASGLRGDTSLLTSDARIRLLEPMVRARLPVAAVLARRTAAEVRMLATQAREEVSDESAATKEVRTWSSVMGLLMTNEKPNDDASPVGFSIEGVALARPSIDESMRELEAVRLRVADAEKEKRVFARYVDVLRGTNGVPTEETHFRRTKSSDDDDDDMHIPHDMEHEGYEGTRTRALWEEGDLDGNADTSDVEILESPIPSTDAYGGRNPPPDTVAYAALNADTAAAELDADTKKRKRDALVFRLTKPTL